MNRPHHIETLITILECVDHKRPLRYRAPGSAIESLVKEYNEYATTNHLGLLQDHHTVQDLIERIELIPDSVGMDLLLRFELRILTANSMWEPYEASEGGQINQFHKHILFLITGVGIGTAMMAIGAVMVYAALSSHVANGPVLNAWLITTFEIFKTVFGAN